MTERTSVAPPSKQQRGQRCEVKLRYRTRHKALSAVAERFNDGWPLQWIYRCPWCQGWHGSSLSRKYAIDYQPMAGVLSMLRLPGHDGALQGTDPS